MGRLDAAHVAGERIVIAEGQAPGLLGGAT